MKKSFLLYSDLEVLVSSLSDMNAGLLFKSILHYATTGNVLDLEDGATNMLYSVIRQRMDAATLNYNEVCRKRSEAGKKGGAKAGNTNAIKTSKTSKCYQNKQMLSKQADNDNDNDNELSKDNNKENSKKKATLSFADRQQEFHNSLIPLTDTYGKEMIRAFFDYWSEPTQNNTKMRLELQRTWSLQGRLRTWERRSHDGK